MSKGDYPKGTDPGSIKDYEKTLREEAAQLNKQYLKPGKITGTLGKDAYLKATKQEGGRMTKQQKLKRCVGCRDNFYNGNNPLGVKECWMLKTAEPIQLTLVGVWQTPPYVWNPQPTLSCHRPEGSVWLKREDSRMCATADEAKARKEKWEQERLTYQEKEPHR